MKTLSREALEINKSMEFVRKSLLPIFKRSPLKKLGGKITPNLTPMITMVCRNDG